MKPLRLLAFPLAVAALPAHAQENDAQLWTSTSAEIELAAGTTLTGELVVRFGDEADGLTEVQYQADAAYALSERIEVGGGYSYVTVHDDGAITSREHRIRQQVEANLGTLLGGEVKARIRVEQRWRDDGDDTLVRLRGRIMWTRPIGDGFSVRAWQESFVHANDTDWNGPARYARSRQLLALRRTFADTITGEVGYISQFDFEDGAGQAVHALSFAVTFGF